MSEVARFAASYPLEPRTVCTEAPLAWLVLHGLADPVPIEKQRRMFESMGFWRSLSRGCDDVGLCIAKGEAKEGDVVISSSPDGALSAVGLFGSQGLTHIVAHGKLVVARLTVLRVIRPAGA